MSIVVQGIEIPLCKPLTGFITPDWCDVVEFYPAFCRKVRELGEEPYDPQPYLLEVAHGLERAEARPGRDRDAWMRRLLEHFGLGWLSLAIKDMQAAKAESAE